VSNSSIPKTQPCQPLKQRKAKEGRPRATRGCSGAPRWRGCVTEPEGVVEVGLTCAGPQVARGELGGATSSLRDGQQCDCPSMRTDTPLIGSSEGKRQNWRRP
jgi:hypothetical protein